MLPTINQPGQLYGTTKSHKCDNMAEITLDNSKFCLIITQSSVYHLWLKYSIQNVVFGRAKTFLVARLICQCRKQLNTFCMKYTRKESYLSYI